MARGLMELAQWGLGWARLPRWLVDRFAGTTLQQLQVRGWPKAVHVDAVWSRRHRLGPAGARGCCRRCWEMFGSRQCRDMAHGSGAPQSSRFSNARATDAIANIVTIADTTATVSG